MSGDLDGAFEQVSERISLYRLAHGVSFRHSGARASAWAEAFANHLAATNSLQLIERIEVPAGAALAGSTDAPDTDVFLVSWEEVIQVGVGEALCRRLRPGGLMVTWSIAALGAVEEELSSEIWLFLAQQQVTPDFWIRIYCAVAIDNGAVDGFGVLLRREVYGGVLRRGEWRFPREQWSLLVGRSGVGKTTLLQMIAGVLHPPGAVGLETPHVLFFLPQDPDLIHGVSVLVNIGLFASNVHGAADVASQLGLGRVLGRKVDSSLSGGEYQRVAIAQALASRPTVLLLDEPFSGLDHVRKWQLMNNFKNVVVSESAIQTVVCVAHDFQSVEGFFDSVFEVMHGRVYRVRGSLNGH